MSARLPPELWLCVFHHAALVPGTLVPDVYAHASIIGHVYTKSCSAALREALVTTRALVRVCKQWWHLAVPYLYRSVYIGRARCLYSLSSALVRSAAGKGALVSAQPLGEYTQRLDIAMRDHAENASVELDLLATSISCMPCLAVVSFAITSSYAVSDLPNNVLDALEHSAASLRVLDWSSTRIQPSASRIVDLLAKCTQLRILNCPCLMWSKQLEYDAIPPTVTTLRLHAILPVQTSTVYSRHFSRSDPSAVCRPRPTALQELILDVNWYFRHWEDLLRVYSDQLISVQLYVPDLYSINLDDHLHLLTRTCPHLRRLTITSDRFFIHARLVSPSVTYLGLRVTCAQLPKSGFKALFAFLEDLCSGVPSLQVVQLLNERNVQCLFKTHTRFAVRMLRQFVELEAPFRLEDEDGVLLTDRLKAFGCL